MIRNYCGRDLIIDMLKKHKVNTIFGYSGGAILPVFDSLYHSNIKYYMNRNEQGAGHCAEGYAKVTGKPGIIVTTSGPGVTNLITPLQDSYSDGIPLVVLTGQVPSSAIGTDAFQECPAIELTRPCTKWNYQVNSANELQYTIDTAFEISLSGRPGPVHIDIPKDIMIQPVDEPVYNNEIVNNKRPKIKNKYRKPLDKLVRLIQRAERPVIIAGHGCNNYSDKLSEFAKKANIPVTTTLHGLGIFDERHKLSLKMLGMHGSAYANYAIQRADLILSFGARFDDRIIGSIEGFAPKAKQAAKNENGGIFQFEIEADQVGKTIMPTGVFIGDCGTYLDYLLSKTSYTHRYNWQNTINNWKRNYPFKYTTIDNEIKTQQVIEEISNQTYSRDDVYITTGVGNHQMMSAQFYKWTKPKQLLTSGSLGTMGVGVPFAIGAQIAKPDHTIICIDGDGSFNMTLTELGTIAEYNIPVKIAIMNDSRQQMVHVWQKLFFNSNFISTTNHNPDYVKLAKSFGINAVECDNLNTLASTVKDFLEYDGPIIGNFIVKPDYCLPLVAPGKQLDDMILEPPRDNTQFSGNAPN